MEAWDYLSAMGYAGPLRLRRAAVCFLSPGLLDPGSWPERGLSLYSGAKCLPVDGTGGGGSVDVSSGAAVAGTARRDLRGRALRRQPLSPGDCVLAQRVCRVVGLVPRALVALAGAEGRGRWPAQSCAHGVRSGGGMADQCASCRNDPLFVRAVDFVFRMATTHTSALALGRRSGGSGGVPGCVLSAPGYL